MDEYVVPAPAHEVATLLRGVVGRELTPRQSADLDDVLAELEALLRKGDLAALPKTNGDLRIIDTTASWGSPDGAPASRSQRDRIKRVLAALVPEGRRTMRPWRR